LEFRSAPATVIVRLDRTTQYRKGGRDRSRSRGVLGAPVKPGHDDRVWSAHNSAYKRERFCYRHGAPKSFNRAQRRHAMAKGQMRSNKEKKKPKADKNIKKGGAAPSPFAAGKVAVGQGSMGKK
jgi:hypothetical protein